MKKLKELSRKTKIILGIILVVTLALVFTPKKGDENLKYETFINQYFSLIVQGNMYELEKYTSNVELFKKIGFFNKEICIYNVGKRQIILIIDELKEQIQQTEGLSAKQKTRLFNKRINDACISYDSYQYYDKFFGNIKVLKVHHISDYETDITINVFSKLLNKYIKMIVTIENDGKGLNMREISMFPTAADFLENQPELAKD
jgi:hypothetical protein